MPPGKPDSSKCGRGMWDWERKRYSGYGSSGRSRDSREKCAGT